MKSLCKVVLVTILAIVLFPYETAGQPGGPGLISPDVQKDSTVTFRFRAPNATEVKLSAQYQLSALYYHWWSHMDELQEIPH